MFGRTKQTATSGNPMNVTHSIVLDGTCHVCRTAVSTRHDHTALLGQTGTATATVTHACGTEVDVSGQF
jgi:hypothetical protein